MKKFLELESSNGLALFIDCDSIVAIANAPGRSGMALIYVNDGSSSFLVKKTHFELLKKLAELKLAELVKF